MMTYVPRGPKMPRDILEWLIWVKGGHRVTYDPPLTYSTTTYVPRGPRTPRDIIEWLIWVKGGHRMTYDPL